MKLNVRALAITAGLLWAGAMLIVGIANMIIPGYGMVFLTVMSSIYPGYHPGTGIASIINGTLYGLVDAGIGGGVFAWLYNCLAK